MNSNFYPSSRALRQALVFFFLFFVFCISATAQIINTVAGDGSAGYTGDGGPATAAEIYYTWALAPDGAGGFYIGSDYFGGSGYNRVRRVNAAGIITTYAGNGSTPSFGGDGGPATAASFYYPGGVATDARGNLYIEDYGNYRIRKVNAAGIISTIAGTGTPGNTGDGGPATAAEIEDWDGDGSDIAADPYGNVYIFEWDYYRIRKIDTFGIITTFAGNGTPGHSGDGGPATAATIGYDCYGIAADGAGNVYFSDWSYKYIRKINSSGIISTVAGTGTSGFTGDNGPATAAEINTLGIAVDGGGNLYLAEYSYNRVRKVDPSGIITTIAGTGAYNFTGDGGPATAATFRDPWGIAADAIGDVYVGDLENWRVREIYGHNRPPTFTGGHSIPFVVCENTIGDSTNSILAVHDSDAWQTETWTLISGPAHGTAATATTALANGAIVTSNGLFYTPAAGYSGPDSFKMRVTDGYASDTTTVHVTVNPLPSALSGTTTCFTGSFTTLTSSPTGGTWSSSSPSIATVTGGGVVVGAAVGTTTITYTLPTGCIITSSVNVLVYAGQTITTIAGNGTGSFSGDSGPATAAEINYPYNEAFDGSGNMYIADFNNNRIRKVNTSGVITTFAGTGAAGFFGDGGLAAAAKLNGPFGLAIDASGNVYFSDGNNHRVRKISASGTITTIAGNGTPGLAGDGSPATAAELYYPSGIALDGSGNLLIADEWNNRIRKVNTSSGIITSIAGNGPTGYLAGGYGGDGGAATIAQINYPENVTVDGSGNIYIADCGNHRVRKINTSGTIVTVAGNGSPGYGSDGIAAISTKLNYPDGLAVDALGNIFIGDALNNRVRKVNASGIITTIAGNGTSGYIGDGCAATAGELNTPEGLALDGTGDVYVADRVNNRIRKISYNHAPAFIAGHTQTLTMCQNSTDTLNTALAITDLDNAQGEAWSVLSTAANGTLAAAYTGTSNGGTLTPTGLYYTPTIGYNGSDSFRVVITDCSGGADTTKIVVIVNPPPSAILGTATVCAGVTTTLSDPVGTGVWSSNNTAVATVTAGPTGGGVVTGVTAGTATITYAPGASCSVTKVVTVSIAPPTITGSPNICITQTSTFTDSVAGGTWSTGSSLVATITGGGVATGVALGITNITYTQGGCPSVMHITVNPVPSYISSLTSICVGQTSVVVDGIPGGSWGSSNPSVATIVAGSGLITGTGPGSLLITYTLPSGCSAATTMAVNPLPDPITGPFSVCMGSMATLTDPSPGGIWSIAGGLGGSPLTVDSASGVDTGHTTGTTIVLYTYLSTSCAVSATVTVNAAPPVITGFAKVCAGGTTALSDSTAGGTWSSGGLATATVDPATGVVTGVATGTTTISYNTGTSCSATLPVTVSASPSAITGTTAVCVGLTTALTDGGGGSWSSNNLPVATVGSTGVVRGVSTGTAVITYMLPSGCYATTTVTVNSSPGAIAGVMHVCPSATTALTDAAGGGTWSSSPGSGAATVNVSTGLVYGVTPGTATITYSLGAGCTVSTPVTINPLPSAIGGTATVCMGATTTLTDGGGGTWSNSGTTIATVVTASGVVTGVTFGTSIITYTLPVTGCTATKTVTVYPVPSAITGTFNVCPGATTVLSDITAGGIWGSGTIGAATVIGTGAAAGTVSGVAPGTSLITYTLSTGCAQSVTVTVNALPALFAMTGGGNYCATGTGLHIGLGGSVSGVSYQLYNGAAPVGLPVPGTGSGLDFGLQTAGGAYTVMATNANGCSRAMTGSASITVNPMPTTVIGPTAECVGATMLETNGIAGGTWSSGTTAVATVTPGPTGGGVVSGVATGTTVITYTLATGCAITDTIKVSISPVGVSGASGVCVADTTTLSDAVNGGAWSSSNTGVATIGSLTGLVTGAGPGTTVITYSLGTGCTVTKTMTVNTSPAGITGTMNVCTGATVTLRDATTGGTWSPSTGSIATVSAGGVVTGAGTGTATISYTVAGCAATATVTINPAPAAISGISPVCAGLTTPFNDGIPGGTWASSNTGIATVDAAGTVSGAAGGTATITYSLGAGCITTKPIIVNPIGAITGALGVCVGATTTLSDAATGGTWSSATTSAATVTLSTGVVSGVAPGSSLITYTTAAGCTAATTVIVNLAPSGITGNLHVCAGAATALSDAAGGGTWTSGNTTAATVITATGVVTGAAPGVSVITYSLGGGCTVNTTVTVNPLPSPVSGVATVCTGSTITLSDPGSGTWSPSTGGIATVSPSGVVTGVGQGTVTITYTPGTGCFATKTVTVNPAPDPIAGTTSVCVGLTTALSDATTGGTWASSNPGIATVDGSGMVTAVAAGSATITYPLSTGCAAAVTVVVNSAPGAIFGNMNICTGSSTTLGDPTSGGSWSSPGAAGIATVDPSTGVVTGTSIGTAAISYTVGGCPATATVTVNSLPPAITGAMNVCVGNAIPLSDDAVGGTWSSPAGSGVVMVTGVTGVVTGVGAGTAVITYSLGAGCNVAATVTVDALPPAPVVTGGVDNICKGYTTSVTDPATGGTWGTSDITIATITTAGVVLGVDGGGVTISYTNSMGCVATTIISVTAVPAITGANHLCAFGDTASVYDAMPGGTWSSTLAPVTPSGLVTGYGSGVATVTYTIATGCFATAPIIVNPVPGPITGNTNFCIGTATTLSDTSAGGIWSPATGSTATVSGTGMVSGISAGTAVISYTLPATGCMQKVTVNVTPHPSAITGNAGVCAGATTALGDTVSGGVWSSPGSAGIATVGAATGVVTGISAGTATITYYLSAGCTTARTITVNPLPSAHAVTGGGNYCSGTPGVHIGLGGSDAGISYELYHGVASAGTVTGTGSAADFGWETLAGTYTVVATNTATTCSEHMPDSVTVTVTPSVVPSVSFAATPANTVCAGTAVTFAATAVNGGTPTYQWMVNGGPAGSGSTSYSYTPADNDVVSASMTSSATCAIPATVSYSVTMSVVTPVTPTVTINATPGTNIKPGESVTLTASISNGGASPAYQWNVNSSPVTGATTATFTTAYNATATVSCSVTAEGVCNTEGSGSVVITASNVGVTTQAIADGDVSVLPNPNNGEFIIKGTLGTANDEAVSLDVTDMLGQVVYKNQVVARNGKLDERVLLNNTLANGMYMLNLRSATGNKVFHIVIER